MPENFGKRNPQLERCTELAKALQPFATIANDIYERMYPEMDDAQMISVRMPWHQLAAARAALHPEEAPHD